MAAKKTNPLELNSNTLKELFKDRGELPTPSFSAGGAGIASTTGGRGTVSQAYQDYLANIDFNKRTPLESALEFGSTFTKSGEDIGRELQQRAKNNIENEVRAMQSSRKTPSTQVDSAKEVDIKPKQNEAKKLYRVMYAGKGAESSEVYETKAEADAALKKAGGKGAVAGINFSQQQKPGTKAKVFNRDYLVGELGEAIPAEEAQEKKQRYRDQLSKTKEISKSESDRLKKIQALRNPQTEEEILQVAENKGRMSDALAAANEAKRAKDKEAGAGFESWRSDVKARRSSEGAINRYSQQLGLLKQAYSQARSSGDPINALRISQAIQAFQSDVPKEMGARKKYFEQNAVRERDAMLAERARLAQEEDERNKRTALANPDYTYSNPFSGRSNFTYQ